MHSHMIMPLKLALISHQIGHNDGQGRVNYEIAVAALTRGHMVTILAETCSEDLARHPRARVVLFNCERYPTRLLKNLAFAFSTSRWLRRHRSKVDVLQVNGSITWRSAEVTLVHFVHTAWLRSKYFPYRQWWRSGYFAYQFFNTAFNAHCERRAFARSCAVVAVSQKVADELLGSGVKPTNILVIHNGVDADEFRPGLIDREYFCLPTGVDLFLFAGDIRTSRKNLGTVLTALKRVPSLHLAVAGGLQGSPYPELACRLGIKSRVHFLGTVIDMPLLMRSVDAFVFPSRYEPFGLVILEAMASGIPVITSRNAGCSELLKRGGILLDDPEDEVGLARSLQYLAMNRDVRLEMGKHARLEAVASTWRQMSSKYLDIYEAMSRTG